MTAGQKLVLLFDYPFSRRDYDRFGVDVLAAHGFDVEIWDFTPFIHPDVHREVRVPDPFTGKAYRQFSSWAAARAALAALPRSCFILSVVYYHLRAIKVYRALARYRLRYGVFVVNALPRFTPDSGVSSLLTRIARLTPAKALWYVVRRLPFEWLGVPPAALVVAGGRESLRSQQGFFPISSRSDVLWSHSFDYDAYLQHRAEGAGNHAPYGVFLDEYLPFHPDYTYLGIDPPSTADAYYPAVRGFLERLEQRYEAPVVIAAHPRSAYEEHPDYFGGRLVTRGRTAELIKSCAFVVAHASSALGFAALFRKPVLFATTPALEAHPVTGPYVKELARWFGKAPIDIERGDDVDWSEELRVDDVAYDRYIDNYIKRTGSEEAPVWQLVTDRLARLTADPQ